MEKTGRAVSFRPRQITAERLAIAAKVGIDRSSLINDALEENLRKHLELKIELRRKLQEATRHLTVP